VWVVNTVLAATISSAELKDMPLATSSRMRSKPAKAAWPSFRCHTVGRSPSPRIARTAPTPSTISWSSRVSSLPP
jgi:hypothetical protein